MKFDKFTVFSTYIFSADITPDMLKLCRVTKLKVLLLVLVYIFNFNLFEFLTAILEKGLLLLNSTHSQCIISCTISTTD